MRKQTICEAVGVLIFIVGFTVSVTYLNMAVWGQMKRWSYSHPQAGWTIHQGTITEARQPDFSSSPPSTQGVVSFRDYYGTTRSAQLDFEQYPLRVGATTEVDVSRNGSIFVPRSTEYDPHSGGSNGWGGPRSADNTLPVALSFVSFFVFAILGFAACVGLESIDYPKLKGRLGTI